MWKNKKHCWRYYHFTTRVPKTTIIWGKAHGIWSETDKICLSHFWPRQLKFGKILEKTPGDIIFLHMFIINKNHMMYGYWDKRHNGQSVLSFDLLWILRYWVQQTEFFVIWDYFLPFFPNNNLENQNLKTR